MISHKYKCIFIHIPKCAGTSVESLLEHFQGKEVVGVQDHRTMRMIEPITMKGFYKNLNFKNIFEQLRKLKYYNFEGRGNKNNSNNFITCNKDQFRSYYKFTIIRNPYYRVLSWYFNVIRDDRHLENLNINKNISFYDFLVKFGGKGILRPQFEYLVENDGKINVDHIIKFENLKQDFNVVRSALSISEQLPHKLKSKSYDLKQFYCSKTISLVNSIYHADFIEFDYRMYHCWSDL